MKCFDWVDGDNLFYCGFVIVMGVSLQVVV